MRFSRNPGSKTILPVLAGLSVYIIASLFVIFSNSPVNDEYAAHITGGWLYWSTGQFAGGVDNPPLGQLWVALPLILTGKPLAPFSGDIIWLPRLANVILGALLLFWIFRVSYRYFGRKGAYISLIAGILSPNFLAHSSLATIEIPSAFTLWAAMILFWKFLRKPDRINALLLGIALGCAFLVKITAFYLPVFFMLLALILLFYKHGRHYLKKFFCMNGRHILKAVVCILIIITSAYLIICAGFGFRDIGTDKADLFRQRMPDAGDGTRQLLAAVSRPLPEEFVNVTLGKIAYARKGNFSYIISYRTMSGWWLYYPLVMVLKMPLPLLLGLIFALGLSLWKRKLKYIFPWVLPVAFLLLAMFTNKSQIGIRHLIPMFPFLFLALGSLGGYIQKKYSTILVIAGTCLLILTAGSLPYPLTFSSILTFGNGYRWLADSNYDWGQANEAIDIYKRENPDVKVPEPFTADKGGLIIRVNKFNGFNIMDDNQYRWLKHFEPVEKVAGVGLVFQIGEKEISELDFLSEQDPVIAVALANYYADIEEYDLAEKYFSSALETAKSPAMVLRYRAGFRQNRGKLLESYRDLRKASQIEPENNRLQYEFMLVGRSVEVERLKSRNRVVYNLEKAAIASLDRDFVKAEEYLMEAEKLGVPEKSAAMIWLNLYIGTGKWDKALDKYKVIDKNKLNAGGIPDYDLMSRCLKGDASADEYLSMADFCFSKYLFDQAAVFYREALIRNPASERAVSYFGQIIVNYVQQDYELTPESNRTLRELTFP